MTIQTNTQRDILVVPAVGDLSGFVGRLAKLVAINGKARARLPEADTDPALYVIDDVRPDGKVELLPLHASRNFRVVLKGICSVGDPICLALGGDAGKVQAVPAVDGQYTVRGYAEDDGVDGQHIRIRPYAGGVVTVEEAYE